MPHETPLITTIVAALVLAFIFGAIANRLRFPPLVGYVVAGILVGPFTPGFVADQALASQLAEIGVVLLMFGVGLHFSLKDLLSVRAIAIPGALVQIIGATAMGWGLATLLGWPVGGGMLFGLALSVASTVVLLKAMQDRRLIDSDRGRIAVGWLIVEDLAMVLALVLIPALAGLAGGAGVPADPFVASVQRLIGVHLDLPWVLVITVVKLAAFVGFMLVVGRRIIPFILHATAHTGSRELFRLAVLAIALGVAAGAAYLFGVSLALGAFFAGMILSESELSQRAAQETLPLRDAFAVLFFVSVGMLFDPTIILRNPLPVLATLFIIVVGKSILAFIIVIAFRRPVSTALTISASLAQIGEFSFILAALGVSLKILPQEGSDLILSGAILSIILNPLVFWFAERQRPKLEARFGRPVAPDLGEEVAGDAHLDGGALADPADEEDEEAVHATTLRGHTVLIGFGRVGSVIAEGLMAASVPFVLIEDAEGRITAARAKGIEVIIGNAASAEVLQLANVGGAQSVLIAIPNSYEAGQATEQCRKLNGSVRIVVRSHSDEEDDYLKHLGADAVIMGEREIGMGMLAWLQHHPDAVAPMTQPEFAEPKFAEPKFTEPQLEPSFMEPSFAEPGAAEPAASPKFAPSDNMLVTTIAEPVVEVPKPEAEILPPEPVAAEETSAPIILPPPPIFAEPSVAAPWPVMPPPQPGIPDVEPEIAALSTLDAAALEVEDRPQPHVPLPDVIVLGGPVAAEPAVEPEPPVVPEVTPELPVVSEQPVEPAFETFSEQETGVQHPAQHGEEVAAPEAAPELESEQPEPEQPVPEEPVLEQPAPEEPAEDEPAQSAPQVPPVLPEPKPS